MKKEKTLTLRISADILNDYKEQCEKRGYSMSKKIRTYIINDLIKMTNNEKSN